MSEITAQIDWRRGAATFTDNRYSRHHTWRFDGGVELPASSSPRLVPVPLSDETAIDPEEAFVASISSCHMLWFLAISAKQGFVVDQYIDDAVGEMGPNAEGQLVILSVTLRPTIRWAGNRRPAVGEINEMHDQAHHRCIIANSVKSNVQVHSGD